MNLTNIQFKFELNKVIINDPIIENILANKSYNDLEKQNVNINEIINDENVSKITKLLLVDRLSRELMKKIYSLENKDIPV